jgi:hypothetical protein
MDKISTHRDPKFNVMWFEPVPRLILHIKTCLGNPLPSLALIYLIWTIQIYVDRWNLVYYTSEEIGGLPGDFYKDTVWKWREPNSIIWE